MEASLFAVVALASIVLVVLTWGRRTTKSRRLIERWARHHGYRVIFAERVYSSLRSPYKLTSSRGQTVFRIKVVSEDGEVRDGWARCGGFFSGLWSDKVEVRLDGPDASLTDVFA